MAAADRTELGFSGLLYMAPILFALIPIETTEI